MTPCKQAIKKCLLGVKVLNEKIVVWYYVVSAGLVLLLFLGILFLIISICIGKRKRRAEAHHKSEAKDRECDKLDAKKQQEQRGEIKQQLKVRRLSKEGGASSIPPAPPFKYPSCEVSCIDESGEEAAPGFAREFSAKSSSFEPSAERNMNTPIKHAKDGGAVVATPLLQSSPVNPSLPAQSLVEVVPCADGNAPINVPGVLKQKGDPGPGPTVVVAAVPKKEEVPVVAAAPNKKKRKNKKGDRTGTPESKKKKKKTKKETTSKKRGGVFGAIQRFFVRQFTDEKSCSEAPDENASEGTAAVAAPIDPYSSVRDKPALAAEDVSAQVERTIEDAEKTQDPTLITEKQTTCTSEKYAGKHNELFEEKPTRKGKSIRTYVPKDKVKKTAAEKKA